jgi:hypothetical protein
MCVIRNTEVITHLSQLLILLPELLRPLYTETSLFAVITRCRYFLNDTVKMEVIVSS